MTSRRDFLEHMGWAMVPLASGLPDVSVAMPAGAPLSLHGVLVDGAHPQARSLGTGLAGRGATVHVVSGDITDLWLREIQPTWKQKPVAIAGLTTTSTLFCLEQLAWVHGLRVAFHAEHVVLPSQQWVHSVHWRDVSLAPADANSLATAGADWSHRIAEVFASFDTNRPMAAAGPSCAGLEPAIPPGASLLTSWIIAPA